MKRIIDKNDLFISDVQEASDKAGERAIHVVDESVEDNGTRVQRNDIVVGNGSRYQATVTCFY